jgi:hypothetical protein
MAVVRVREKGGAGAAVAAAVAVAVAVAVAIATGLDTTTIMDIMDTGFTAGFTGLDTTASTGGTFADEVVLEVMEVVREQFP